MEAARMMEIPEFAAGEYPNHMDVELSSKCNLRCRFCHLSYFNPKESAQISLAEFQKYIGPMLPHMHSITLFNKFEALTCRDFVPIFRYLSEFDIETYFSTNGLLLSDDILDVIVGKLTYLTVSITGFTPASYRQNMNSDGYQILRQNLTKLNALKTKRSTRYPILRISTVGMLDTLEELTMAIDFAAEFGAEEGVQMTSFKSFAEPLNEFMPLNDMPTYTKVTKHAIAYAKDLGIKLVLQSGSIEENREQTEHLGHRYCDLPWHRLSVQPDGEVYPCPMAYAPIGNVNDTPLRTLWNGAALDKFRRGVNDPDNMNSDCANCTHCRHRSLTLRKANDFSAAATYPTGMRRKEITHA
jgi:radical SAM protein with 4Fe4S-binding SPASM domain